MPTAPIRRKAVLLLLAALLAAPWVSLAEPRLAAASPAPLDLLSRLWSFLASLWSETGCQIDPNGCAQGAAEQGDEGCRLDPNGCRQGTTQQVDEGCHLDPDGCANGTVEQVDEGCSLDPNGCRL